MPSCSRSPSSCTFLQHHIWCVLASRSDFSKLHILVHTAAEQAINSHLHRQCWAQLPCSQMHTYLALHLPDVRLRQDFPWHAASWQLCEHRRSVQKSVSLAPAMGCQLRNVMVVRRNGCLRPLRTCLWSYQASRTRAAELVLNGHHQASSHEEGKPATQQQTVAVLSRCGDKQLLQMTWRERQLQRRKGNPDISCKGIVALPQKPCQRTPHLQAPRRASAQRQNTICSCSDLHLRMQ